MHPLLTYNIAIIVALTALLIATISYDNRSQLFASLRSLLNSWDKRG